MNDNTRKTRESVKELLDDPYFILWCYAPTPENEAWWKNWIENHPKRETDISDARAIILSTQLNKTPFPAEESEQLYARIRTSAGNVHRNKQKRKQRQLFYSVAAACIACLLISGLWLYIQQNTLPGTLPEGETLSQVVDSIQTEIELETAGQEKLLLSNKSTIKLNEEGAIHIAEEAIIVADKAQEESQLITNINTLRVPRGRHTVVELPDGSKVWVNSGTVLQFPAVFEKEHRTIHADGEIYLEVAKDASRPFYVQTSQMKIRVLGTSFNVTAYDDEPHQSVVLKEGLVEVNTPSGLKQNIQPNQRLVLENAQIEVSKVNPYHYISWIDGVFIFDGQPLSDITHRLSRYYNKSFVCAPGVANYRGTGKLVLFSEINKVLQTLEESLPVACKIEGDSIIIDTNKK